MRERRNQRAESGPHRRFRRSWVLCSVACMGIEFWCPLAGAQEGPRTAAADAGPQDPALAGAERDVSWRTLPQNVLQDQKDIWLFPVQLGKGRHWLPTLLFSFAFKLRLTIQGQAVMLR